MYTLRKITENQVFNQMLGDSYTYIDRDCNPEDFRHYFKSTFSIDHVADLDDNANETTIRIKGFVVTDITIPIYKDTLYYVMTDSGKTFECLNNPRNN